jgi:sugar lactone lactonase YvrE
MRWAGLVLLSACSGAPSGGDDPVDSELDCTTSGQICTAIGTGDRGWGDAGGPATATTLFLPTDVGFDLEERPIVVDYNNMRVLKIDVDGTTRTVAGMGVHAYASNEVDALATPLENAIAVAIGPEGQMYLNEQHGARILRVVDGWLDVYAGSATDPGLQGWTGDGGPALGASFSQFVGLTAAPDGTLFVGDTGNNCIRAISPDGVVSHVAGNGDAALIDGLDAAFNGPQHLAWHDGALYVADTRNHAVRHIDLATGIVTTLAGDGMPGATGDGGPAIDARIDTPQGVAVDAEGRVYIADSENHVVRRIELDGTIDVFAGALGVEGYLGDGEPATDALLQWPTNVRIGPDGTVWIADTLNSVMRTVAP